MRVTKNAVIGLVLVVASALSQGESEAGANWAAKVAVHVLPHEDFRTCSQYFPDIDDCGDISTTCASCSGVDVFPVFFDIQECLGVEYALSWPGSGSCAFTPCSDLHIGDIIRDGDGISQVWFSCRTGFALVPGFGWIDFSGPARICVAPHPVAGYISVLDCSNDVDEPVATFCAGVCGETGDNPCEGVILPLGLEKTDGSGGSCVIAGDSIIYAIAYDSYANLDDVHNVVLTDDLPSDAEFMSCSAGGMYDSFDHRVTWDLATLPGHGSGTAKVTVSVGEIVMPGGSLENRCAITSDETPTTQATVYTDVCPEAYEPLNLVKYDDTGGDCVDHGQDLTYTLTYDNVSNPYDVHGVILTDFLPDGIEYVSCSGGGVYDEFDHEVVWNLGTLAPGGAGQVEIVARVDDTVGGGTQLCNIAGMTSSETPPTEVTDRVTVCADLISIDLTKTGYVDSACADRGDSVAYEIDYRNLNSTELQSVYLIDYLPDETEFVSSTTGGTYEPSAHSVTWPIGSLAAGQAGALALLARVKADAVPGVTMTNRCEAYADGTLPSYAEAATSICPLAPLNLAKTDGRGGRCVSGGTRMTYVIAYDNLANTEVVDDVVLTDYLSSSLKFRSASDGGVYEAAARRVVWNLGSLPGGAGDTVRLAVEVTYTAPPGSNIRNRCEIAGTGTGVTEATSSIMVCESGDSEFKAAVHVTEHAAHRTCISGMPVITACGDIVTTSEANSVDAFPIFFDLTEYQGVEYGLAWCDSGTCESALFTSCSDLVIGDIEQSGDGISQVWLDCKPGPIAVPGWAWIYTAGPSIICIAPHPVTYSISVLDCSGNAGTPMSNFCAGVYGEIGDDPCAATNVQPTTWGGIKAMFR